MSEFCPLDYVRGEARAASIPPASTRPPRNRHAHGIPNHYSSDQLGTAAYFTNPAVVYATVNLCCLRWLVSHILPSCTHPRRVACVIHSSCTHARRARVRGARLTSVGARTRLAMVACPLRRADTCPAPAAIIRSPPPSAAPRRHQPRRNPSMRSACSGGAHAAIRVTPRAPARATHTAPVRVTSAWPACLTRSCTPAARIRSRSCPTTCPCPRLCCGGRVLASAAGDVSSPLLRGTCPRL